MLGEAVLASPLSALGCLLSSPSVPMASEHHPEESWPREPLLGAVGAGRTFQASWVPPKLGQAERSCCLSSADMVGRHSSGCPATAHARATCRTHHTGAHGVCSLTIVLVGHAHRRPEEPTKQ